VGAFLGIANPATELRKALEEYSGATVNVTAVSAESPVPGGPLRPDLK